MCDEVVLCYCEVLCFYVIARFCVFTSLRGFVFFTSLRGFVEAVAIFYYEMICEKVCDHHNDADDGSVSVLQGFVGGDVLECGEFL